MALGEGLGRLFDVEPAISGAQVATNKSINLKDFGGVTFVCWVPAAAPGGEDTFIVKCSGGTSNFTAFNPITRYYNKAKLDGTVQWTDSGDLSANVGTILLLSGSVAFYVGADDLPAGSMYVQVVPGTSGVVTAIMHDPVVQRDPKYLRAPNV
jgi:hypothetical protein